MNYKFGNYGFLLPNGDFRGNDGSHEQTAKRLIEQSSKLKQVVELINHDNRYDLKDVLIIAGCAALGGARGVFSITLAKDNNLFGSVIKDYEQNGGKVIRYYTVNSDLQKTLLESIDNLSQESSTRVEYGFLLYGESKIRSNSGNGHNTNAMRLIQDLGYHEQFVESRYTDAIDFLIFQKGAIQIGSGGKKMVIYSATKYFPKEIDKILDKVGIGSSWPRYPIFY